MSVIAEKLSELFPFLYDEGIDGKLTESMLSFDVLEMGTIDIFPVSHFFWIQVFSMVAINAVLTAILATVVYKCIIQQQGSTLSYLVGYGVVCPIQIFSPFYVAEILHITNMGILMASAAAPILLFFRCIEAMHGAYPGFAAKSMSRYLLYYTSPLTFAFDPITNDPIKMTPRMLFNKVVECFSTFLISSTLTAIMSHTDHRPFPHVERESLLDYFHWGNLLNSYMNAHLVCALLNAAECSIGGATEFLTGNKTIKLCNSPLTKSTSPSDFWGRRWNALIHSVLKGGVYKPIRKSFPKAKILAGLATFAASGLMHEHIIAVMAHKGVLIGDPSAFQPRYGIHMLFFLWNGIVLGGEAVIGKTPVIQWMSKNLPQPIRTALVIMTVLPIGHWFSDEYVSMGFFADVAVGFPRFHWTPAGY